MFLGEISFCDKTCYNIKSDDYKKNILQDLENSCGFKIIKRHHEDFNFNQHLDLLQSKPFLISVRSNGNPYLLYLTKYNFVSQSIFIDKKIQSGYFFPRMILSNFLFDESLFENTLLDGEMVKTKNNNWIFIVNDILLYKGKCTFDLNLVKRINLLNNILINEYLQDELDYCNIYVKKYFKYSDMNLLIDFIKSLPYSSRGIYFKSLSMPKKLILYNFDSSLIRKNENKKVGNCIIEINSDNKSNIKSDQNNLISNKTNANSIEKPFYIKKTPNPDVYELYDQINSVEVLGIACVMKFCTSKILKDAFESTTLTQRLLFDCAFNNKLNKWTPIKLHN